MLFAVSPCRFSFTFTLFPLNAWQLEMFRSASTLLGNNLNFKDYRIVAS